MEKNEDIVELLLKQILKGKWVSYESLHGGMMNRSFLIKTNKKNQNYILYIPGNNSVAVNRQIEKMTQDNLSALQLTSKNIYFDLDKGIKINEFILGKSLDQVDSFDYQKVATLLQKIHQCPFKTQLNYNPFYRLLNEYEPNALLTKHPLDEDYFALKKILLENRAYLESVPTVLSHNDFQRSNIIKGDDDKYYVIDFEFAMDNDPIYDIAAFGNGKVEEGRKLLDYYFNQPSKDEIKRYYLWRIYLSLQWYLVAINKDDKGEGKIHNFDFLAVADHFLNNAREAKKGLDLELNK